MDLPSKGASDLLTSVEEEILQKEQFDKIQQEQNFEERKEPAEDEKKKKKEKSILRKISFLPWFMLNNTKMCKHNFGCFENTLRGWYRSFIIAFAIKALFMHLPKIFRPLQLLKNLVNVKQNLDAVRFALFAAFLNALYKGVLCIMRRFCSDDRKNAFVAGFLSALSMAIDDKERRKQIALIVFARSLDSFLNILDARGLFKKFKYGEVLVWTISGTFNKYCMSFEPECLTPAFRKFYQKAASMTKADIKLCEIWAEMVRRGKI